MLRHLWNWGTRNELGTAQVHSPPVLQWRLLQTDKTQWNHGLSSHLPSSARLLLSSGNNMKQLIVPWKTGPNGRWVVGLQDGDFFHFHDVFLLVPTWSSPFLSDKSQETKHQLSRPNVCDWLFSCPKHWSYLVIQHLGLVQIYPFFHSDFLVNIFFTWGVIMVYS